jgi:hypothetical protein
MARAEDARAARAKADLRKANEGERTWRGNVEGGRFMEGHILAFPTRGVTDFERFFPPGFWSATLMLREVPLHREVPA